MTVFLKSSGMWMLASKSLSWERTSLANLPKVSFIRFFWWSIKAVIYSIVF